MTGEKIIFDNIENKKFKIKADILHAAGVHSCFDDIDNFLKNIINRCNDKGEIYIHGSFNMNPVDVIIRYRDCTKKNFFKHKIDQSGWNNFSKINIVNLLKKNKKVKKFKFYKINFPKKLNLKRSSDPLRSWTINYNNKKYFINSLNILQHQYILKIWRY